MTYTPRLRTFNDTVTQLRRELTKAEDDYLELRDREKKLGVADAEGDADLANKYRMKEA